MYTSMEIEILCFAHRNIEEVEDMEGLCSKIYSTMLR